MLGVPRDEKKAVEALRRVCDDDPVFSSCDELKQEEEE